MVDRAPPKNPTPPWEVNTSDRNTLVRVDELNWGEIIYKKNDIITRKRKKRKRKAKMLRPREERSVYKTVFFVPFDRVFFLVGDPINWGHSCERLHRFSWIYWGVTAKALCLPWKCLFASCCLRKYHNKTTRSVHFILPEFERTLSSADCLGVTRQGVFGLIILFLVCGVPSRTVSFWCPSRRLWDVSYTSTSL